jgi:hypothetical protein
MRGAVERIATRKGRSAGGVCLNEVALVSLFSFLHRFSRKRRGKDRKAGIDCGEVSTEKVLKRNAGGITNKRERVQTGKERKGKSAPSTSSPFLPILLPPALLQLTWA